MGWQCISTKMGWLCFSTKMGWLCVSTKMGTLLFMLSQKIHVRIVGC